jgi:hypothetical protein
MNRPRPLRRLERITTRDERVPLNPNDPEMMEGWRCIPVPPTDDPAWFIIDSTTSDKATVWGRWHDAEGSA